MPQQNDTPEADMVLATETPKNELPTTASSVLSHMAIIDMTDNLPESDEADAAVEQIVGKPLSDVLFETLNLPDPIQRAVDDLGFSHCTPIQALALPHALKGRDLTGQAQTGTGKTAAFLITILKEFLETDRTHSTAPRAVVVAPTRELALQIADDANALSYYTDYNVVSVFGGMDWQRQARDLEGEVDIVVGTPGRMMDYMKRGILDLSHVQVVVVDEADRLFDMGFIQDIRFILDRCARTRQTLLFSATFPFEVARLTRRFMNDPIDVKIEPDQITAATIEQIIYHVAEFEKLQFLLWLLEEEQPRKALVFTNTKRAGEWLGFKLHHNGWDAEYISGDIPQKKRLRLVDDFKNDKIEVLVATDVAGRGLHVDDIDLVVNFDLPEDAHDYVHRIGRTGRAGNRGKAVSLADERLVAGLVGIERYIGRRIKALVPDDEMFLRDQSPSYRASRPQRGGGRRDGRGGGGRGRSDRSRGRNDGRGRSDGRRDERGPKPTEGRADAAADGASPAATADGDAAPKKKRRRRRRRGRGGDGQGQAPGGSDAPSSGGEGGS